MEIYIFLGLVGLVRLITAVVLLRLAAQRNLPNLRWLAIGFILTVVDIPFTAQPYVPYIDKAISYVVYLCFAIFILRTFYQGKRSPFVPFWAIFTLLYAVMFFFTYRFMNDATGVAFPQNIFLARPSYTDTPMSQSETIDSVIYGILQLAIWLWHAIAGFQASRLIATDNNVERWVKSRYKLIVAYAILQSMIGVVLMIRPFLSSAGIILSALLVVITTMMQYLVWVMPEPFRRWLNGEKNTRSAQQEEQSVSILEVLGAAMTTNTGLKSIVCMYAIRTTVGKRIGSEDSNEIRAYISSIPYKEWEAIFQHSELRRILINGGADNTTANQAIENARQALIDKQSLLTFSAH